MAGLDFSAAVDWLQQSMAAIPEVAEALLRDDLEVAAACFDRIAESETKAFTELIATVTLSGSRIESLGE